MYVLSFEYCEKFSSTFFLKVYAEARVLDLSLPKATFSDIIYCSNQIYIWTW